MTLYYFDNSMEVINTFTALSYTQTADLNGTITAEISAIYSEALESAHYFGSADVDDESVFVIYRVTSVKKEDGTITLRGIHILFDELQSVVIRDTRPQGVSAGEALSRILQNTGWSVGTDTTTGKAGASYYHQSALSAFWDYLDTWQVEFWPRVEYLNGEIVGRYIDITDQLSDDYGKWYEYGDRLINVVAEQANESIYTALIGMGKGEEVGEGFGRKIKFTDVVWSTTAGDPVDKPPGQDYVSLPSASAIYGHREAVIEFPDIDNPAELLAATYRELLNVSRPRVEFSADVLETGRAEIGETLAIIRPDLGIRYKTRIFSLTRDFLEKSVKEIRFGDRIRTSSAERIRQTEKESRKQEDEYVSLYELNRQRILESYYNEGSYEYRLEAGNEYELPAGTYNFDRPIDDDPTSVLYMGGGKILIADSKLPDGSWNYKTFLNGSGLGANMVTANSIAAGSVTADHIDADGIRANQIVASDSETAEDKFSALTAQGLTLTERANQADGSVQQINAAVQLVDGALHTAITDIEAIEQIQAKVLQDQTSWQVIVEAVQAEMELNTVTVKDVRKYLKFDDNFLTIGRSGSTLEIQITNEAINFLDGGEIVAWITGQQLHISSAVVEQSLTVGNHVFRKHDASGITVVRWVNN